MRRLAKADKRLILRMGKHITPALIVYSPQSNSAILVYQSLHVLHALMDNAEVCHDLLKLTDLQVMDYDDFTIQYRCSCKLSTLNGTVNPKSQLFLKP